MTNTMKNSIPSAMAALVLVIASLFPLAHAQTAAAPASGGMAGMSGMDMKAMMKDNNDKMASMKMTGDPDVDFATMMKMHHQGAITMAEAELKMGHEAQMKKMAKDIIAAQKKEIAQFENFLAKHKK